MRKNGINRELRSVEGGVCAPDGYAANAVACGVKEDGELDFAMIFSEKRCSVACVYASGKTQGAPVKISKRNMKNGYARAILVNGGGANIFGEEGERLALAVCDLFFPFGVERGETVIASTGEAGKKLRLSAFESQRALLWQGLDSSDGQSRKAARAIGENGEEKQLSFGFDLGDYPCKMGVIFSGGSTSPSLTFLTTDVNISTQMLQKALNGEVKETLQLLRLNGVSTPNDTVCILANGRAGNYRIDYPDAEYKKFVYALKAVLTEVCKALQAESGTPFFCRVKGAVSKEVSRSSAKALVGSTEIKASILKGKIDLSAVVFTLLAHSNEIAEDKMEISLAIDGEKSVLYDGGRALPTVRLNVERLRTAEAVELFLDLREGNFQSLAFGRLE